MSKSVKTPPLHRSTPPKGVKQMKGGGTLTSMAFYVISFVLYVLCFTSMFKPHLEIVGFGLLIALHIILSFSVIYRLFYNKSGDYDAEEKPYAGNFFNICRIFWDKYFYGGDIGVFIYTISNMVIIILTGIFIAQYDVKLLDAIFGFFSLSVVCSIFITIMHRKENNPQRDLLVDLYNWIKTLIAGGIMPFVIFSWVGWLFFYIPFFVVNECRRMLQMDGPFKYHTHIPKVIGVGIILLSVAFIMFMMTLIRIHAKHSSIKLSPQPEYIPGNFVGDKSDYKFQRDGIRGSGYYLTKNASNYFFNDDYTIDLKEKFKVIATTLTVAIATEFLGYIHYKEILETLEPLLDMITPDITDMVSSGRLHVPNSNIGTKDAPKYFVPKSDAGTVNGVPGTHFKAAVLMDGFSLGLVYGILALSATSVWITQKIGSRMGAVTDPPAPPKITRK